MAKKAKKIVRREYTRAEVKELRAHSKARTPVAKIAKLTKRSEGSLRQKARKLGISWVIAVKARSNNCATRAHFRHGPPRGALTVRPDWQTAVPR